MNVTEFRRTLRHPRHEDEHQLQCTCVRWFWLTYGRSDEHIIYSIPNGGYRSPKTASDMRAEGQLAGVADLFLPCARHGYHGLYIEMKTPKGRQSESQRWFQAISEREGYRYAVCRSFDEFRTLIDNYMRDGGMDKNIP